MPPDARRTPPSGKSRPRTHVTRTNARGKVVRVRTIQPWNRVEFFAYLDQAIAESPNIKHVGHLAELAGISHTTLSNWRSEKQRPTAPRLAAIARVLGVEPRHLYALAGIVEGIDGEGDAPPQPPGDWYEQMVNASNLPPATKESLIKRRREDLAHERRRLAEDLRTMESLQSD